MNIKDKTKEEVKKYVDENFVSLYSFLKDIVSKHGKKITRRTFVKKVYSIDKKGDKIFDKNGKYIYDIITTKETMAEFNSRKKSQDNMVKALAINKIFYDYNYELMKDASRDKGSFFHLFFCKIEDLINKNGVRMREELGIKNLSGGDNVSE